MTATSPRRGRPSRQGHTRTGNAQGRARRSPRLSAGSNLGKLDVRPDLQQSPAFPPENTKGIRSKCTR